MITRRFYETADTLVYDPVASNRNATRAALHSLGFRRVEGAATLEILTQRLRNRAPDLLLVEVAGAEQETCATVQAIRQGTLGENPFIVVIVTTWRRDGTIIHQVLNSGADDLVARPVSTTMLGERIRLLVERRKDFVVTYDYIGPDRRREPRGAGPECSEVPNPLKLKMTEGLAEDEAERLLAEAVQRGKEKINLEKIRRDSVQLCLQWRMLEQRTPGARDFCEILRRMEKIASEMLRRARRANQEAVQEWCDSVTDSVRTLTDLAQTQRLDTTGAEYRAPLGLLGHAALTLGRMFAPGEVEPARLVELDRMVAVRKSSPAAA